MRLATATLLWAVFGCGSPTPAQDRGTVDRVDLRVTATGPGGSIVVDRGTSDRLSVGDTVILHPRLGGSYRGTVVQVDDRSAVIELTDRSYSPGPGTRGEALVPVVRVERTEVQRDRLEWRNQDESWLPDMPLLSQVGAVRPSERETTVTGRVFTIGSLVHTETDRFDNSFIRTGVELLADNPFGKGGGLRFDGEFNYKTELGDDAGSPDLLLRRFGYFQGGHRFSDTRWEVGRFLQYGMPEFGVLDGFEGAFRTRKGDLMGASVGFMPEPDDDVRSLNDFQIAGYYLWSLDARETLTMGGGYQKSFHNGDADRDLFVAKLHYLPSDHWYVDGTVWVDYYTSGDVKGVGLEVSQAIASVGRRWDGGGGLDLTYRRQRFPDIDRHEFILPPANDLVDNRYDRLALSGFAPVGDGQRVRGQFGAWDDDEESGGFGDVGITTENFLFYRDRLDLSLFTTFGRYDDSLGARVSYGRYDDTGHWEIFYEVVNYHHLDFPNDQDDLLQHRLRLGRSIYTDSGWSLNFDAGLSIWDTDLSWSVGAYVQKTF